MKQAHLAGRIKGLRHSQQRRLEKLLHRRHPAKDGADQLTLESLAEDRESERKIGGGILAGLGLLFFINTGDKELNTGLRISGTIISGIGIAVLAIKSKAEKKYNKIGKEVK